MTSTRSIISGYGRADVHAFLRVRAEVLSADLRLELKACQQAPDRRGSEGEGETRSPVGADRLSCARRVEIVRCRLIMVELQRHPHYPTARCVVADAQDDPERLADND